MILCWLSICYFAAGFPSNNFQTLGHTVESEVQQRIFTPLGMKDTLMPASTNASMPLPFARGYELNGGSRREYTTLNPSWAWAAGSSISTVHDLGIWAKSLATGQLLPPALQAKRLTWSPIPPSSLHYGLAIMDLGAGYIGHDGRMPGYESIEGYEPETHTTLVVLADLGLGADDSPPADTLANVIALDLLS